MHGNLPAGTWTSNQASFLQDMLPVAWTERCQPGDQAPCRGGKGVQTGTQDRREDWSDQQRSKDRAVMIINSILVTAV